MGNSLDPTSRDYAIRTVIGEAGQSPEGQAAVAAVIRNRLVKGGFGDDLRSVVLAPGQFEPWSTRARELMGYDPKSPAYQQAAKVVDSVFAPDFTDPTNGATHFYAPVAQARLGRPAPAWGQGTPLAQIGGHNFYAPNGPAPMPEPSFVTDLYKKYSAAPAKAGGEAAPAAPSDDVTKLYEKYSTKAQPSQPGDQMIGARKFDPSELDFSNFKPTPRTTAMEEAKRIGGRAVDKAVALPGEIIGQAVQDFSGGKDLAASGLTDLSKGNVLPNFPSADPNTWGAGGLVKTATGTMGMVFSPVSGAVNKLVQEPATELTGNPEFGERVGLVANTIAGNKLMSKLGGAPADAETLRLANVADRSGVPIRAAQISNNPLIQKLDQAVGWIPGSGRQAENVAQQNAFTRAVSRTFGEDTPQITRSTIQTAQRRIGGVMNDIEARTPIRIDDNVLNGLAKIDDQARRTFTATGKEYAPIKQQIDHVIELAAQHNGVVPGDAWAALRSHGSPLDRLTGGDNSNIARFASEIKNVIQDAVQRSATPEDAAAYTKARFQYKNMKTVEPLVTKGTPGEISPAGLNQRVNSQFGVTNAGPLGDLADAGQRFLRPPRDSGTPLGNFALNVLTAPGTMIGGAVTGAGWAGLPVQQMVGAGIGAGTTALAARGANALLNNPIYRNSLLRQAPAGASAPAPVILPKASPATNALLQRALPLTVFAH